MSDSEMPVIDPAGPVRAAEGGMDFGALAAPFTPMDTNEAAGIAEALYGLSGRMTRFSTEKDDTFRLEAADGAAYVLKIANPGEHFAELDLHAALLRHVAGRDETLPVPRIFAGRDGKLISSVTDAAGDRRFVRLMSFLSGTVLDTISSTPDEREAIGRVQGRLRLAMADFHHEAARRVIAWDVRHLPALAALLPHVSDAGQKRMLEAGLERFNSFAPVIAGLRRQMLHNDFSRSNIVVDRAAPDFVKGIIDFDDAVETAIAIDVSTALLNQLPRDAAENPVDDLFEAGRDLLRGYLSVAELTREELSMVPHLVMGRVIGRALLTLWRARLFPGNSQYILRNTEQGWAQLEWFLERSPEEVSALLL